MTKASHVRIIPWQILLGLLAIAFSFLLMTTTSGIIVLFTAMTLLTVGEAVYVPGVPALINAYTVGNEGKYQGLVNSFSSVGKALGPVLGGVVIGQFTSFKFLFFLCAIVDFIVAAGFVLGVAPLLRRHSK